MRSGRSVFRWVVLGSLFALPGGAHAQGVVGDPSVERTLSPYFEIQGGVEGVDMLPLSGTDVDIHISGVIAAVVVRQVYQNRGPRPIHAKYVFPASTRAAVNGLRMRIGARVVEAVIREKETAREEFKRAQAEGKNAALLEQVRPNVFDMRVANIMPGDRIEVELRYTEILVPHEGTYEFVYPTVVGPRYTGQAAPGGKTPVRGGAAGQVHVIPGVDAQAWPATAYAPDVDGSVHEFSLDAVVSAGVPIRSVSVPSHDVEVDLSEANLARVSMRATELHSADRDYVLRYSLADAEVQSGFTVHRGETENFFMLMVEPPARVTPADIPPRDFVFVMDVSGSMRGYPLDTSKRLMGNMIRGLREVDSFNVLLFSGGSRLFSPVSVPATAENVRQAWRFVDDQRGGGGTELPRALARALSLPRPADGARTVVVITDGYISGEAEAFRIVRERRGDASVFAFGIGSSVNRYLVEGIARAGMSEPFVVMKPEEADEVGRRFREYVSAPVLTNVRLDFQGLDVYDLEPSVIPDVLARRPVVVVGKFREGGGRILGASPEASARLSGVTGAGAYTRDFELAAARPEENAALRYLWARRRIAGLTDPALSGGAGDAREEITRVGLEYGLLTRYTSFVAVDRIVRNPRGEGADVQHPQPLPKGMQSLWEGTPMEVGAEPELWLLLVSALLAFVALRSRRFRVRGRLWPQGHEGGPR